MRGAEILQKALVKNGVSHVFGILGREAEALAFTDPGLRFILTRHEFTAGVACDAYARVSGKAQACFSTFGPGATNLSTGIASSCLDRSPMLAMSAQIEKHDIVYNHVHQCLDQAAIMRPMCKYSNEVQETKEIASEIKKALDCAYTELFGPSYLSLPLDILTADLPTSEANLLLDAATGAGPVRLPRADPAGLKAVHEALVRAKRPVAIVGNGIFREDALQGFKAVVHKYGLPVISSLASKGALPEEDDHNIGPVNRYLNGILKR
ncbi:MAG: thiamine pyrophosphate-binding protein, partial [Sulfobacillus sp.]